MSLVDTSSIGQTVTDKIIDGSMIKDQSRLATGLLALPRLVDILKDPRTPAGTVLDVSKHIAELGDLKPKAIVAAGAAVGFSININVPPGQIPTHGAFTPEGQEALKPPTMILDVTPKVVAPAFDLPPMPAHLRVPDFVLTRDLVGPKLPNP